MKEDRLKEYLKKFKSVRAITLVGPQEEKTSNYVEPVIYVDGGANFRSDIDGVGIVVGDGDSTHLSMDVKLDCQKNFSDLAYALASLPNTFEKIYLKGFLGGRRDHELMNMAEVHRHLLKMRHLQVDFSGEVWGFAAGSYELNIIGLFSTFLFADTLVELTGACDFEVLKTMGHLDLSSRGLSNRGRGKIFLSCEGPFFILFKK